MDISESQSLLMETLPQWNHYIARPFKRFLDEGMSPPMFHGMQRLRQSDRLMTMTELAKWLRMPKQQATKLVDRLIERSMVERVNDPNDRRLTRLRLTPAAIQYMDDFKRRQVEYYRELLLSMPEDDRQRFTEAIRTLHDIFGRMPCADGLEGHEKERE